MRGRRVRWNLRQEGDGGHAVHTCRSAAVGVFRSTRMSITVLSATCTSSNPLSKGVAGNMPAGGSRSRSSGRESSAGGTAAVVDDAAAAAAAVEERDDDMRLREELRCA